MVGRRAIEHPWIFREAFTYLRTGEHVAPPTDEERIALCKHHLVAKCGERSLIRHLVWRDQITSTHLDP